MVLLIYLKGIIIVVVFMHSFIALCLHFSKNTYRRVTVSNHYSECVIYVKRSKGK